MTAQLVIRRVTTRVYRAPLSQPVTTSFGVMRDRPMVLVEIEDSSGTCGFGEVWCNFPAVGAEHRARIIDSVLAPLLLSKPFSAPSEAFDFLTRSTDVLAIQSAEPGPFAQAIAGLDTALWDLAARRAGKPLWQYLNSAARPTIGVYASGLNPTEPESPASTKADEGFAAFKLKIGFGRDRDVANLTALRQCLGETAQLMVDANQAWDLDTAMAMLPYLEPFGLNWLEEPLRADVPWSEWQTLASRTAIPLAAGENIAGRGAFDVALDAGAIRIVQPDMAKWGGFSGCVPVAKAIRARGKRFCPHYLGGGIGLLASAHLLAAVGGDGLLEIDSNPNPLRSLLCGPLGEISDGKVTLLPTPGLGIEPDLIALSDYRVPHGT